MNEAAEDLHKSAIIYRKSGMGATTGTRLGSGNRDFSPSAEGGNSQSPPCGAIGARAPYGGVNTSDTRQARLWKVHLPGINGFAAGGGKVTRSVS